MRQWITCLLVLCVVQVGFAAELMDEVVAIVNDDVITASELDKQTAQLRQQLAMKQVTLPPEKVLKKQVLQHLIDVNLELQLAKQQGLQIQTAELKDIIKSIAERNKITPEEMKTAIEQQGMTWQEYEENLRKEVLIARLQQKAVGEEVVVSQAQVKDYLKQTQHEREAHQKIYHLQNIVIPLPEAPTSEQLLSAQKKAGDLLKKIQAGADFSEVAIAESSDTFALEGGDLGERHLAELPEVFAQTVQTMQPGEVKGPLRTGNGLQLLKLVGVSGGEKTKHLVAKTHVRHILIKPSISTTPQETKAQLDHLYQQLKAGASFAKLAKQYSLDPLSAMKGGDLGWVNGGELVPEFQKAMESLPLHQVSKPVKTRFGWHFIEVLERKTEDDTPAFEREQVRQFLHQRKFTESVQNWQQRLRGQAYIKIVDKQLA